MLLTFLQSTLFRSDCTKMRTFKLVSIHKVTSDKFLSVQLSARMLDDAHATRC